MYGNGFPGQFPNPNQPNRPGPRIGLVLLIIALIALFVGISTFGILYFVVFKNARDGTGIGTPTTSGTGITNITPVPSGHCTANGPYGFTTIHADSQLVALYKQLNVCWVRYQYHWDKIETRPGVYDWSQVDASIATMNAANIHVDFAIQSAPQWDLMQSCFGVPYLTGPQQMTQFATAIASRYDGQHGHGKIEAFEIGNEEYDQHFTGDAATSEQCRKAGNYGPVLKAGYQAIKAVYPAATVGMFGQWYRNINHIKTFFNDLFSTGYGSYMDYMNFHFYNGGKDPSQSYGVVPSFDLWWQTIHTIATKYGFGSKLIWVTEVGWPTHPTIHPEQPVAPDVQAQYLQYIMQQAAQSHVVQKVFWFTINYGNQGDSIYPNNSPLPAFSTFQTIVRQMPGWN